MAQEIVCQLPEIKQIGRAAGARVENHSWSTFVDRFEALFQKAVNLEQKVPHIDIVPEVAESIL